MLKKTVRVVVLLAFTGLGLAWAEAQEAPKNQVTHRWVQKFGMVTPAFGQTLRLHAVHLNLEPPPDPDAPATNPPPEPGFPPDPCRVVLVFIDSEGRPIGSPVGRTLDLGKSTFIDFSFVAPITSNVVPPDPCRATVWIFQRGPRGGSPPDPCKATLEVLDTASGRALIHMLPAVQHALPAVR
jgi:hypothetical protein